MENPQRFYYDRAMLQVQQRSSIYDYFFNFYCDPMISAKRPNPYRHVDSIVIDSDQEFPPQDLKPEPVPMPIISDNPYDAIPEVPTIRLTSEQMETDPIALIKHLEQKYEEYGAVKLKASEEWNMPYSFGNVDKPVTVRRQVLQDLTRAKPFEQLQQCMRFGEYKEKAMAFSKNYRFKTNPRGHTDESRREQEYWSLVRDPLYRDHPVTVEYAADLPTSQYGSGFPRRPQPGKMDFRFMYESSLFNLNNIYKSPNSMLRVVDAKKESISGISQPWMYVGMQFATFCWHVEDLFINSVNYNHSGATKTWYVIPACHKERFDQYVHQHYQNGKKKYLLQKITLMVDPLQILRAGIKVYKIQQRPKDYACTFVKAYHGGFSHGFNVTEAVNFLSYDTIDTMKEAMRHYEAQQAQDHKVKSSCIPYEWIIYQNINQSVPIPHAHVEKMNKQYKRIINREYLFVKGALDNHHQLVDVEVLGSKRKYTSNKCSYCKNYLYLTSLMCHTCNKNLCPKHLNKCQCDAKKWRLLIRQLNKDRVVMQHLVPAIGQHQAH